MPYRTIRGRLLQADTWLLEAVLGLYTLVWGLGFLNPLTDTFASNPTSYAILGRVPGGENVVGLLFASAGTLELLFTAMGSRFSRGISTGAVGLLWLLVTILIGVPTRWAAGGLPHFALVAVAHWYCWARLHRPGTT